MIRIINTASAPSITAPMLSIVVATLLVLRNLPIRDSQKIKLKGLATANVVPVMNDAKLEVGITLLVVIDLELVKSAVAPR